MVLLAQPLVTSWSSHAHMFLDWKPVKLVNDSSANMRMSLMHSEWGPETPTCIRTLSKASAHPHAYALSVGPPHTCRHMHVLQSVQELHRVNDL
jgi:hypothetical protein